MTTRNTSPEKTAVTFRAVGLLLASVAGLTAMATTWFGDHSTLESVITAAAAFVLALLAFRWRSRRVDATTTSKVPDKAQLVARVYSTMVASIAGLAVLVTGWVGHDSGFAPSIVTIVVVIVVYLCARWGFRQAAR